MKNRIYIQKLPIPDGFNVPVLLETKRFRLRPLTIHDAVKDYDAVITSIDHIKSTRGIDYGVLREDQTLEDSIIACAWHQAEFGLRTSFAYTVMSLDEKTCLGCVYIYYSDKDEFDAEGQCG